MLKLNYKFIYLFTRECLFCKKKIILLINFKVCTAKVDNKNTFSFYQRYGST